MGLHVFSLETFILNWVQFGNIGMVFVRNKVLFNRNCFTIAIVTILSTAFTIVNRIVTLNSGWTFSHHPKQCNEFFF